MRVPLCFILPQFVLLIAIVASIGLYWVSLDGEFAFDDHLAIIGNGDTNPDASLAPALVHDFWGQDITSLSSHKSYRPVTVLLFRLLRIASRYWFGQDRTIVFHIANVVLHALCTALVYIIGTRIVCVSLCGHAHWETAANGRPLAASPAWFGALAACLFAVHPVHTEAVSGMVCLCELVSTALGLCAFVSWFHSHLAISDSASTMSFNSVSSFAVALVCLTISIFAKETGTVMCALMICADLYLLVSRMAATARVIHRAEAATMRPYCAISVGRHSAFVSIRAVCLFVYFLLYTQFRRWLTGFAMAVGPQVFRHVENPIAYTTDSTSRVLSLFYLHFRYLELLAFPTVLSADWSFNCVPLLKFYDVRNAHWILAYTAVVALLLLALWRPLPHAWRLVMRAIRSDTHTHTASSDAAPIVCVRDLSLPATVDAELTDTDSLATARRRSTRIVHTRAEHATSAAVEHRHECVSRAHAVSSLWLCPICSSGVLLFGVAFLLLPFVPASNLFFWVGTLIAERLMFAPSIGLCFLYAWLMVSLWHRFVACPSVAIHSSNGNVEQVNAALMNNTKSWTVFAFSTVRAAVLVVMFLALVSAWACRTVERNSDWVSEERLFLAAYRVCPNSVKVLQNVGILHRRSQQWDLALSFFTRAQDVDPTFCETSYWIGLTLLNSGKPWDAIAMLKKSLSCTYARNNAATALQKIYSTLLSSQPANISLALEWADILSEVGQHDAAASQLLQVGVAIGSDSTRRPLDVLNVLTRARQQHRLAYPVALASTQELPQLSKTKALISPTDARRAMSSVSSRPEPCELSFALGRSALAVSRGDDWDLINHIAAPSLLRVVFECDSLKLHALDALVLVWKPALEARPTPILHLWASLTFEQLNQIDAAIRHLHAALALDSSLAFGVAADHITRLTRAR